MREDKFKLIKEKFIDYFEQEALKINQEIPDISCKVEINFPPNEDHEYGYLSMHLSCLLNKGEFEGSDNITLEICAYDLDNKFNIESDICWGHPSGKIEAAVFGKPVEVTEENIDFIKERLPELTKKLKKLLRNNSIAK